MPTARALPWRRYRPSGEPGRGRSVGCVPPMGSSFRQIVRQQLRTTALDAAHRLVSERGWASVRMGQVAAAVGVSRQTLYNEFGSKDELGTALVQRETDQFVTGVAEQLARHADDLEKAVTAAVGYALEQAATNPLVHAVLTSARTDTAGLLPLLTTRSEPVLTAASTVVIDFLTRTRPDLDTDTVEIVTDSLVRLTVSHIVLPTDTPERTARKLSTLALRALTAPH